MESELLQEIKKLSDETKLSMKAVSDETKSSIKALSDKMDAKIETLSNEMNKRFEKVDERLEDIESDLVVVKRSTITMEAEHGQKLQILMEVNPDIHSDNIKIKARLEEIDKTLEDHSTVIKVVKEKNLKGQPLEQA